MAVRIRAQTCQTQTPVLLMQVHVLLCVGICFWLLQSQAAGGICSPSGPNDIEWPISWLGAAHCQLFCFFPRDKVVGLKSGPACWGECGFRMWLLHQCLGLEFSISLKKPLQECIISPQGFLAKDLQAEALCKLDRRVKATIEQFMKILEEIDTLVSKYSAEQN